MSTIAQSERAALADLFEALGPDAPTLCTGWTTADLAAHLVVRERRPDSLPGIRLSALTGHTERVRIAARDRGYPALLADFRAGPPWYTPFGLPGVDGLANGVELFVHHEDVRRAQEGWTARALPAETENTLWKTLGTARMLLRSAPAGVTLAAPGFGERVGKRAEPMVVVSGAPAELVLFSFGRQAHAQVTTDGDAEATERLLAADLGV